MTLKPCPFCGNRPTYDQGTQDVWCPGHTDKLSVRSWNDRHIPEGFALVPVDPTEYMVSQGDIRYRQVERDMHGPTPTEMYSSRLGSMEYAYRAMIAAAQEDVK